MRTRALLRRIGLGAVWDAEDVGTERQWKPMVRKMLHLDEESSWRTSMAGKSSLLLYSEVKEGLQREWFLMNHRAWVSRMVRMRMGAGVLEAHRGRFSRVSRHNRVCRWCGEGCVEDAVLFLDSCPRWEARRSSLWEDVVVADSGAKVRMMASSCRERAVWLLRGGDVNLRSVVLKALGAWYGERERLERSSRAHSARSVGVPRRPVRLVMRRRSDGCFSVP